MARPVAETRAGFTLIEVLISLVLGAIIVTVLFQLMLGEGKFVQLQSAREEVQQNTRASLELISSELRTLPAGDALVSAAADSITLRTPRVWGTICAVTGATTLDVAVPAVSGASYTTNGGTGLVVNFGTATVPVWNTNSVTVTAIGAASATCNGTALATGVEKRSLALSAAPVNGALAVAAGQIIYLYDEVTYRAGESSGVPGLWVQRRMGTGGSFQPMAGPIRTGGAGLRFAYFAEGSALPIATPIGNAATRATVTRVRVIVESVGRNSINGYTESKMDTMLVSLRNRGS